MERTLGILVLVVACSSAQWTDTFRGTDQRMATDAGFDDVDEGGVTTFDCNGLAAMSKPVSTITVSFPGYGTPTLTMHVVTPTGTCDLVVDSSQDNVLFSSDASPCAPLLAPAKPVASTAVASGPDQLVFQWSYGLCEIDDNYALSKQ